MFFSIIIPTYNPKPYLSKLLQSVASNNCIEDIEIIISDDRSIEPFDEIIQQYSNLNIKNFLNDKHYGYPAIGRQNGLDEATGEWICFIDQDDYFIDNAFDILKETINKNQIKNCLMSSFYIVYEDNGIVLQAPHSQQTHGKLFEKTFLEKYNIKYNDIKHNEDTCFVNDVKCISFYYDVPVYMSEEPYYYWIRHPKSLSTSNEYRLLSLVEYIKISLQSIFKFLTLSQNNDNKYKEFIKLFLSIYIRIYFYQQTVDMLTWENYQKEKNKWNILLSIYMKKFKELTIINNTEILEIINNELDEIYNIIRMESSNKIMFEHETFEQWLNENFPD